jgi:hypothetical protein
MERDGSPREVSGGCDGHELGIARLPLAPVSPRVGLCQTAAGPHRPDGRSTTEHMEDEEEQMSVTVLVNPKSLTHEMYGKATERLRAAGQADPKGRTFHVCSGSGDKLSVFEVWNSREDYQAFGAVLMPILADVGIEPGQPKRNSVVVN